MDYALKNIYWLLPEESAPCDFYLYFRGKFVLGLKANSFVSFEFLEKIWKAGYFGIYIRQSDENLWNEWITSRHRLVKTEPVIKYDLKKDLHGTKKAEYLSYIRKAINVKDADDKATVEAMKSAIKTIEHVVQSPMLEWYFQQFHEPPDLFQHGARVTMGLGLFCALNPLLAPKELEDLLFACIIHELQGSPDQSLNTVVSSTTLEQLQKHSRPVSKEVLALIEKQDELCSGKGFPHNCKATDIPTGLKIFSLFNHYDHYRLLQNGTRRAKHEAVKRLLEKRKQDFDANLWKLFWFFLEEKVEVIQP